MNDSRNEKDRIEQAIKAMDQAIQKLRDGARRELKSGAAADLTLRPVFAEMNGSEDASADS